MEQQSPEKGSNGTEKSTWRWECSTHRAGVGGYESEIRAKNDAITHFVSASGRCKLDAWRVESAKAYQTLPPHAYDPNLPDVLWATPVERTKVGDLLVWEAVQMFGGLPVASTYPHAVTGTVRHLHDGEIPHCVANVGDERAIRVHCRGLATVRFTEDVVLPARGEESRSMTEATRDEAWSHAACLSIAEGVPGWDKPTENDSPAMQAVRKLRVEYLNVLRERDAARIGRELAWDERDAANRKLQLALSSQQQPANPTREEAIDECARLRLDLNLADEALRNIRARAQGILNVAENGAV